MADGAPLAVRRYDICIADLRHCLKERCESRRMDAVIVCHKDKRFHLLIISRAETVRHYCRQPPASIMELTLRQNNLLFCRRVGEYAISIILITRYRPSLFFVCLFFVFNDEVSVCDIDANHLGLTCSIEALAGQAVDYILNIASLLDFEIDKHTDRCSNTVLHDRPPYDNLFHYMKNDSMPLMQ